ncbi:MAG: hypothetical protein ABI675_19605 [Chitinophagaceae bacterium]
MKTLILLLFLAACTKEQLPEKTIVKSATQLHHYYDVNNKLIKTDTMFHVCRVDGDLLKSYQDAPVIQHYCDRNETLEWKFGKPCASKTE